MTLLERYLKTYQPCTMIGDDVWVSIKRSGDTAELSFQGTATARGVLIDADFPAMIYKRESPRWWVHRGFGNSFKTAIDTIAREIDGVTRLYVYGYSKGGGYSILMHEWAIFNGIDVVTINFGAPAIMYAPPKEVRERFKRLYRVYIQGDWCSILGNIAGYKHVGQPVRVGGLPRKIANYHSRYTDYLADL